MRTRKSVSRFLIFAACCAAALFGSHSAAAKDKGDLLPQWASDVAQTPTPAGAKDAPTVILFREYLEAVDAQGRAVERKREAIRILQPQARDQVCAVWYDVDEKINYFRAWTLGADGRQYQAKDTDFFDHGADSEGIVTSILLDSHKARVVHPPATDVGATVFCESEELKAPWDREMDWDIQETVPLALEALEIDLPPGLNYSDAWHRFPPVKPVEVAPNHWRWEIKNMPALDLRDVKASLDPEALDARMYVQWGDAAVAGVDSEWRALGLWYTNLESHRADPSPEITAESQQLVAGAPDFFTKLTDITEYIQKNVRYFVVERGIGGFQSHFAGDIFRNRYGDCKDKTTLLISMLQAVGIQAHYVLVDDRRGVVDPDAPSLYGDHMITAIEIPTDVKDPRLLAITTGKDGKRYLIFDPTNEHTPVGNLPYYLQGSYGILSAGDQSQLIPLPVLAPDSNGTDEKGAFTLSADGSLSGSVDTLHTGSAGADFRWILKYTDDKERLEFWEKYVGQDLPNVTLTSFQFVQPTSLAKPLEFHYKVIVPNYAHQAGPLLLVRPRVVDDLAVPFDDKPRQLPINLTATGDWHDSFDITLPPGYVVDETPDPVDVDMDFASYHSTTTAKGNVLHYERDYVVRQVEIPPDKAADFRKLESAILFDEKGAAVLKKQ
jgi:hypothetical protein